MHKTSLLTGIAVFAALFLACFPGSQAQEFEGQLLVKAQLVADTSSVVPGKSFQVGLLMEMAEGWHTYWESAGDAGLPTKIVWSLPEGFTAGPIQWPTPKRLIEPGDIHAFGYKGRVMLLITIQVPENISTPTIVLNAKASWLVCKEICIPGSQELSLELPVATSTVPSEQALFEHFRSALPITDKPPFSISWQETPEVVTLTIAGAPESSEFDFLVTSGGGIHPQIRRDGSEVLISVDAKPPVRGLLIEKSADSEGKKAWLLDPGAKEGTEAIKKSDKVKMSTASSATSPGLFLALFYGFLGGLILNLMPCVLPVISLKIFGFIRQAGDEPARIFRHGLAFAAGIFAWFLGLGLVVILIRASGAQATWAFQFQNPWFNLVICCVVFVFALNLFGVFELVLPGRAAAAIDQTGDGSGYMPSFFQGVFATLLATPCTAPFLGSALGFAFSQPAGIIGIMFAAVAAGMALPYVILSAQPGWLALLPKPGPWMERLKQFMGFPLLATLLWLLYVLGNQKGTEAVIWACGLFLCLGLACWIYGSFCGPLSSSKTRGICMVLVVTIAAGGIWFFGGVLFGGAKLQEKSATAKEGGLNWVPFSEAALAELLAKNQAVFLDFTADWCISCKFNERTAIDRPAVRAAFAAANIVPMKADWTNSNPEITKALAAFGRVGVPFYILYPPGRADNPIILPEILTEQIVLDAIQRMKGKPEI